MNTWHVASNADLAAKLVEVVKLVERLGGDLEAPPVLLELERALMSEVVFRMRAHEPAPSYLGDVDLAGAAERVNADA